MSEISWSVGTGAMPCRLAPIPVYNVPPGEETYVRFLGAVMVCEVHWIGTRCLPHTPPFCPLCKPHGMARFAGYAPAQRWIVDANGYKNWLSIAVCLTDSALLDIRDQDVRGQVWTLCRSDKRPRSQLLARYCETNLFGLAEPFDTRPIVENIWKHHMAQIRGRRIETTSPLDPRAAKVVEDLGEGMASPLRGNLAKTLQARITEGGAK